MYCTNCGAELSDNARFCTTCGEPIDRQPKMSPGTENRRMAAGPAAFVPEEPVKSAKPVFTKRPELKEEPQKAGKASAPGDFDIHRYTQNIDRKKIRNDGPQKIKPAVWIAVAVAAVVIVLGAGIFVLLTRNTDPAAPEETMAVQSVEMTVASVAPTTEAPTQPTTTEEETMPPYPSIPAEKIKSEPMKKKVTVPTKAAATTAAATTEAVTTKAVRNGWILQNGTYYYYRDDKPVKNTFVNDGGKTYYMNPDGTLSKGGWVQYNGAYYYIDANGCPVKGDWINDGTGYYYLDGNGIMKTGWCQLGGHWYYFGSNGKMYSGGWFTIDGQQYCFAGNGAMYANTTTPDGILVDADGHPVDDGTMYSDTPSKLHGYYTCFEEDYSLVLKFSEDGTFQARRTYYGVENNFSGKYKCDPETGQIKFFANSYFDQELQYYDVEIIMVCDRDYGVVAVYKD